MELIPYEIRRTIAFYVSLPRDEPDYASHQYQGSRNGPLKSEVADLKRLRLVNQSFAKAAAEQLFFEILLVLNTSSFDRLRIISEHSDYSKYVKTLRYEPNTAHRSAELDTLVGSSSMGLRIYDTEIMTDVHEISDSCHRRTYLTDDLEKNGDCQNRYETREVATAIMKLPNLEQLNVHNATRYCWYHDCSATQELEILLRGVYSAGITLKQFESNFVDLKLLLLDEDTIMVKSVFNNLHHLSLTLRPDHRRGSHRFARPSQVARANRLSDLLSAMKELRYLNIYNGGLHFDLDLSQFTNDHYWPFLHGLALGSIRMTEEALIKFLQEHATTLRMLSLGEIWLVEGTWNSVLSRIRDDLRLQGFHSSDAWIQGTKAWDVSMYMEYNDRREIVKSDGYDLAMAIRQYVLHGGYFDIRQWPSFT